jgi:hypothetical protein
MAPVARLTRIARAGLALAACSALVSGCATTQARVAVVEPPPPLAVPAPPPRIVVPTDPTPVGAPEEAPAPVAPTRPRPSRPAQPKADPRTEAPKPVETAEAAKPNGGSETLTPPPTLEMQPGDRGETGVRQLLAKAAGDLQRVDYAGLSNDLKAQYDTAKRFITLGEQALKEQNVIFAATLADKAGAIATLLLRR